MFLRTSILPMITKRNQTSLLISNYDRWLRPHVRNAEFPAASDKFIFLLNAFRYSILTQPWKLTILRPSRTVLLSEFVSRSLPTCFALHPEELNSLAIPRLVIREYLKLRAVRIPLNKFAGYGLVNPSRARVVRIKHNGTTVSFPRANRVNWKLESS